MVVSNESFVLSRLSFKVIVNLLLLIVSTITSKTTTFTQACKVTLSDGTDVTTKFLITDDDGSSERKDKSYIDCVGQSKCRDVVIKNCPSVKCVSNEACMSAKIYNVTRSVLCDGLHACHRTEIRAAPTTKSVSCIGSESCDVTQVYGYVEEYDENKPPPASPPFFEINCEGVKACRKIHAENVGLVKCHGGTNRKPACDSLATFDKVGCLYCGKDGCADHINTCRYKLLPAADNNDDNNNIKFTKCLPESIVGNENICPVDLQDELKLELSGTIEDVTTSNTKNGDNDNGSDIRQRRMVRGGRSF